MKFTIGYPIHNKSHMIDEIINGLIENIKIPTNYIFIFDGCTDNSEEIFDQLSINLKGNIRKIHTDNLFQLRTNNILMKEFDTDYLIIFQDDMVLKDVNFLDNIIKIHDVYKEELGLIGCRDGFNGIENGNNYIDMISSKFSGGSSINPIGGKIISSGEFFERNILNIGPIIFHRKLIDLVGYFDEIYNIGSYEEMEYSLICKTKYNLKNIILGLDLIHSKFDYKLKKIVEHTSSKKLIEQYHVNNPIFTSRWSNTIKELIKK